MAIGATIMTIQDIMRKDSGVDGDAQRIGQLVWMLFLKVLPPLAEQARIVAKVDHLMALCDSLEAKIRAADEGARRLAESLVAELIA